MALETGTRLGPYEILALIGAGGMGEVYKARDTRLDRTVAIKTLSPQLAADAQFRERFDREARVISQLDHPNICALYDVGEHHGRAFLSCSTWRARRSPRVSHGLKTASDRTLEHLFKTPAEAGLWTDPSQFLRRSSSPPRSRARSMRHTPPASCIATSSRAT